MIARQFNLHFTAILAALALVVVYVFVRYDYNVHGGLLVFLGIGLAAFFLVKKMAKAEGTYWFSTILIVGLIAKLAASVGRMISNLDLYGGLFDAGKYFSAGQRIAQEIRGLDFSSLALHLQFSGAWGTAYTELYSGIAQTIIGPTVVGLYLLWALLGFIGSYFYYRAFCIAFPHGDRRLYALIVFLLPSIVFWSNGLGKDALMAFFIGLTAYGVARALAGDYVKGLLPLGLGLFGSFTVRPHMTGLLVIALAAAFTLGGRRFMAQSPIVFVVAMGVAAVLMAYLLPVGARYAGLQDVSLDSLNDFVEHRQTDSFQQGGSAFKPPSLNDPASIPMIYATVSVRPFPWEAHNAQAYLQSVNGLIILGLILWKIRRVGGALRDSLSNPYIVFILFYLLIFGPSFITIPNFGTLAREQAMLHPLLLMLVAYQREPKPRLRVPSSGYQEKNQPVAPAPNQSR